jgi:isopropylmalate/homocitrate/citramalate synthase
VSVTRDRFNVPVETHFHQDYGMGVANSLIAAAMGANVIQTTVSGIGERAGNTPFEETVLALRTLYNQDIGIRLESLSPLGRLVCAIAGVEQPSNRPITGTRLFDVESGIPAGFVRNTRDIDLTETLPYLPSLVGQSGPTLVLGKGNGLPNIDEALERLEITANDAQKLEMLTRVKLRSLELRGLVDDNDFRAIANSVLA